MNSGLMKTEFSWVHENGMTVTRLRRIREGKLWLGKLEKGKWRFLTGTEVESLK